MASDALRSLPSSGSDNKATAATTRQHSATWETFIPVARSPSTKTCHWSHRCPMLYVLLGPFGEATLHVRELLWHAVAMRRCISSALNDILYGARLPSLVQLSMSSQKATSITTPQSLPSMKLLLGHLATCRHRRLATGIHQRLLRATLPLPFEEAGRVQCALIPLCVFTGQENAQAAG